MGGGRTSFRSRIDLISSIRRMLPQGNVKNCARDYHELLKRVRFAPKKVGIDGWVHERLNRFERVVQNEPLDYPQLVALMRVAKLIVMDSADFQEEVSTFRIPVLVTDHKTDHMSGVKTRFAKFVGTETERIVAEVETVLNGGNKAFKPQGENPYGDGKAAKCIALAIEGF